jgi:2-dehydro-3-deoxyphosphogalactonate aldolase
MPRRAELDAAITRCPLIAILRGVRPDEIDGVSDVLVEAGFSMMEIPLNSPDPLNSISRLAKRHGRSTLVGAGTVLDGDQVEAVVAAGGRMIISPNTNVDVISSAVARGVVSLPGYFTPTEALSALAAGASGLKLFPAEAVTPAVLKAHRAVLPRDTPIFAVGGVTPDLMHAWLTAGATGFGLGSALYRPGVTPAEVSTAARRFVGALPEDPNGNALSCS